jgi:cyclopropane fatty-acyl-phospholipid synthase-like methyltransferase
MPILNREEILTINRKGWNKVAPIFYGGTALPNYGPLAATEDELNLIPDLSGKTVLELGCGSGHSLSYLWENKNASELWGLDLSEEQIRFTQELLEGKNIPAKLFLAPMDENPGIPENHFDLIVSIYALGWTPDLSRTLTLVCSYLKPGGVFIFSGEHPSYQCLEYNAEIENYIFARSYGKEGPEFHPSWKGTEIVINSRKLSTYLNALTQSNLVFDQLIENELNIDLAREQDFVPEKWYSVPRAQLIPTTFIVKAHKQTES